MGTTPDVLKMIGLPDVEVKIQRKTLAKVMHGKHSIEPETLKQLPKQINDPVGVFQSSPNSSNPDGYVVLTELVEFNKDKNVDEPIIAALHLNNTGEVQLIEVASSYGKNHRGLQNILNKDKAYYWNKTKGSQLANVHWLQLPLKLRSYANLSANNIKTEENLSQYQEENFPRFSQGRTKAQVEKFLQTGDVADLGKDVGIFRQLAKKDYQGLEDGLAEQARLLKDKAIENFADNLLPAKRWIESLPVDDVFKLNMESAMYRMTGKRDAQNEYITKTFINPLMREIGDIAAKHGMDKDAAIEYVGMYASAKYAPYTIKNSNFIISRNQLNSMILQFKKQKAISLVKEMALKTIQINVFSDCGYSPKFSVQQ